MDELVGTTKNGWKIISHNNHKSKQRRIYFCRCKCGEERYFKHSYVINKVFGGCDTCRMDSHLEQLKRELIGTKFNDWTVIGYSHKYISSTKSCTSHMWFCKCKCGNIEICNTFIARGKLNRRKFCHLCSPEECSKIRRSGDLSNARWNRIITAARKRNIPFTITKKWAYQLFLNQDKKCALTGINLSFGSRAIGSDCTASLDRIDSLKGYVEGNVQWLHKDVNKMKWELSQEAFLEICKLTYLNTLSKEKQCLLSQTTENSLVSHHQILDIVELKCRNSEHANIQSLQSA